MHTLPTTIAVSRHDNKQKRCRTGEEYECEELCLRGGSSLACGVMAFASSIFLGLGVGEETRTDGA